jgi:predicted metal-dependent hydrolase
MLPLLRYTLDLFSTEPVAAPVAAATPAPANQAGPQPDKPPFVPGVPLTGAIDPAHFAHPQANREIRLADAVVSYAFSRAKRKTIGFVIGPEGLVVRAPRWTPLYEVDAALKEKGNWILRKLEESRERQSRAHSAKVEWCDGVVIPYLGHSITVQLDPTHGFNGKGAQLQSSDTGDQVLHVGLPKTATPEQIRDAVQAWLMREALSHFKGRMDHFTPLLGVRWSKLRLSSAGTRCGV